MAAVTIYWYGPERPASRRCLVRCAALFAGEPLAGAEERWPVQESEKGKPFFPLSPETHCSVTHSGDYWLGAFSSEPIGIDLQIHKPGRLAALSRRFFHPEEDRYLQAFGFSDFYRVWAAKESFVKFSGEGISGNFGRFSVAGPQGILSRVDGLQLRFVPFRCDYTLCVCAKEISSVQLVPGK
ncbi:MAG: 4'-phosphopantetheinyl transferase superfamily protein [Oscillospiraceae bacterium]|mgnify:FL=1|jgi:4'-phosphopantetheinyl transferase|nr:4'-phosphopantetheinyl transferase superfamily protein [Oscillospiraceae bacterium]MDD7041823.1 4'-phosphopantetheinyl transferase superfamily protein [Oscillospiraceae bacterium]MDY2611121.1 4'-phosphopantetheinyl transferase superfamily protein [Oscillospiraceae bacterium]